MSARIVSHRALVLILMAGSFGAWGQAPLRKPDAPDPTTVQPKDAGAKRPAAAREQESRESVRGNARWAPAIANGSPLATSACTSAVSTSSVSTDPPLFPYTGGTAHLNVFAPSSCQWKVSGNVGWLTPGSGTSATVYSGQGTILFNVTANSGSFQTGQIIVSDAVNGNQLATHMVAQAAAPVAQPAGVNFNAATANFSYCTSPQAATSQQTIISIDGTPAIAQPVNAQAASGQNFPAAFSNAPSGKSCNWTVGAVSDNWLQGPALQSLVSTDATSGVAQVPFGVMANQRPEGKVRRP